MSQQSTRKFISQLAAVLFTLAAAWCLLPAQTARADGITVTNTYPVSNALNITTTTTISAAFSHNISATTVTSHSFAVRGLQGGLVTGTHGVINGNTIIVTPTNAFHAGEVVMVNTSSQIESSDGITVTPYAWQFTVDARHGGGDGDYWTEQVVDVAFDGARSVYAADVDGDNDLDVLGAAYWADAIAWWENTNGDGTAWSEHIVDADFDGVESVYAADVDGDGDLDVLGAAINAGDIVWWENVDQTGPGTGDGTAWSEHTVDSAFDGAFSVYAADVDGDGDLDVLGAAAWVADIAWWENTNGAGTAWSEHTVDTNFEAVSVYAADVDGDGDLDVLGAAVDADDIAWWENVDQTGPGTGDGTTWSEHSVDADFDGAASVYAADVDGDGDLDVLGAAITADDIAWWENTNGDGTVWSEHSVDADFDGTRSVYATDVDGDGDLDVLGAAYYAGHIAWWENANGDGTAWSKHSVNANFDGGASVYAADVDGDGDLDVLGADAVDDDITVWLNKPSADLVLSKSCMPHVALPGDAITYTLSFSNAGGLTASDVVITDSIPVSVTHSSLSYTCSGALITATDSISYVWEVQDLTPGDGGVITITGVLSQGLSAGPFTNTATIATATTEVVITNNGSAVSVAVQNVAPVLDAIGNQSTDEETELAFTATANDANGDTLSYSLFNAPSGASIGSSSGAFSWTPTEAQGPGNYQVTIIVSDAAITDSETLTITVNEVNLAPMLYPIGSKSVDEETELAFIATATDADAPTQTLTYSLVGAPTGALINDSSGAFSWTPTEMQGPDNYQVTIVVSDTIITHSENITITVNEVNLAPVLAPIGNQSVDEETELAFTTSATDADIPTQILNYSLLGAPTGASINSSSGLFSWTPTEVQGPGNYQVTIIVSDTIITDSETITITVNEVNLTPVLNPIGDKTVDEETELTFIATATDADVPTQTLSYSLAGAPSGATINDSSGQFSWAPTEVQGPGNYQVTIVVSDTVITDSETITITVNEVNLAPVLDPIGDQSVDEETELTFTVTATDTDVPAQTLSYSVLGAPAGATINSSSGLFSWTPTEAQGPDDYQVTIVVSDTIIVDSETITITVSEVNTAPTVSDIPDQSTGAGVAVGPIPFTVNDADIPTNTLTLYKASSNTDMVATTHIIFGGSGADRTVTITPTTGVTGAARITITVSDGDLTAHDVFTLSVTANNPPQFISSPVETATVGAPYTYAISATDADAGDTLTFIAPISDTWLTLTQPTTRTASLTGTPLIAGEVPVVLQVTDGEGSATQAFTITVSSANQPPVADAGKNQTVVINTTVTLDGSGSADPDGGGLIYGWVQIGGTPIVTLSDSAVVSPTFTAPGTPTTLTFTLVVTDALGLSSAPDTVVIAVTEYHIYLPSVLRNEGP